MSTDRPMNEYEGALFSAMMVLTQTVAHLMPNRMQLAEKYREAAQWEKDDGRKNAAATLELLARIAEEDRIYATRPRSLFTVIEGGKSDDPPEKP